MIESTEKPRERALAIALVSGGKSRSLVLEHLDELAFLAETAGADVIERIVQELPKPNSSTYVGSGKVEEIKESIEAEDIQLALFDDDLTPAQVKNLENELQIKVVDRSGIILDIFAAHARTNEAKTQVELAQLEYLLPRLSRMWTHLSKQVGGIGMKGPGETQIETDRRLIRKRITLLKGKLEKIATQKATQRKGRESMTRFALVGYTNAGKSSLMNLLSSSEVYVRDKLFATLDTTVRTIEFENGRKALLSDTVGFIRKLPSHLVASFRSTLAEIVEADVLLHVVDVSHPAMLEHIQSVNETLKALKVNKKTTVMVYNKIDALESVEEMRDLMLELEPGIAVSAHRGINISGLKTRMLEIAERNIETVLLAFPYSEMRSMTQVYELGDVIERRELESGIYLTARIDKRFTGQVSQWLGEPPAEDAENSTVVE